MTFERATRFLAQPVGLPPRTLFAAAAVLIVATYFLPLWNLTMFAPQYQEGLQLDIYSHRLAGGHAGQDIKEINLLNHYIGMHPLADEDFDEFKWMPFALGGIALLFLRGAVLGSVKELVDATTVFVYFGLFSLWSFAHRLYGYGHDLAPTAPVKVEPFMPPLFGYQRIANFEVYSYPRPGTYVLLAAGAMAAVALVLAWRGRQRGSPA